MYYKDIIIDINNDMYVNEQNKGIYCTTIIHSTFQYFVTVISAICVINATIVYLQLFLV